MGTAFISSQKTASLTESASRKVWISGRVVGGICGWLMEEREGLYVVRWERGGGWMRICTGVSEAVEGEGEKGIIVGDSGFRGGGDSEAAILETLLDESCEECLVGS